MLIDQQVRLPPASGKRSVGSSMLCRRPAQTRCRRGSEIRSQEQPLAASRPLHVHGFSCRATRL